MGISFTPNPSRPNRGKGLPPESMSIGTSSVEVVGPNDDRAGIIIKNVGPMRVWLAWDNDAVLNKGFALEMDEQISFGAGLVSIGDLNAIVMSSMTTLAWQELENA